MPFSYSQETIEDLKNRINIVDVIGRDVKLKRAGSNFKGLCPFHTEKTPSFVVSESKQYFTCFGCGARGDVIEYEKKQYNLDFAEAVEKLAKESGITLEKKKTGYDDKKRARYFEINQMAARFFFDAIKDRNSDGYKYISGRGLSDKTLKRFGIGFADASWNSLTDHLRKLGVSDKEMIDLGLMSTSGSRKYDKFRNRVIFPIINTSGKVIGFGGRAISSEDEPKYLNSPENAVFKKKNNLYGLNMARRSAGKEGSLILVEGYMDAVSLAQSGIENVVASLGTALTENQAKLMHRYTGNVYLSYDADQAGRKAANRGLDILRNEGITAKVLHVTHGKDPDEYVKEFGKDAFLELLKTAKNYGDYKLDSAKEGYDFTKREDKIEYLRKASDIIAGMDPVEQDVYEAKLSEELGVSKASIVREVESRSAADANGPKRAVREHAHESRELESMLSREANLIKIVAHEPSVIDEIKDHKGLVSTATAKKIMNALYKQFKSDGRVDLEQIIDGLDDEEQSVYSAASSGIIVGSGKIDDTIEDIIRSWKIDDLVGKEKEILTSLSLEDDESSGEKVKEFQNDLIGIREEIRKLKLK